MQVPPTRCFVATISTTDLIDVLSSCMALRRLSGFRIMYWRSLFLIVTVLHRRRDCDVWETRHNPSPEPLDEATINAVIVLVSPGGGIPASSTPHFPVQFPECEALRTSRSGADGRGDRISSRAAEPELDPRRPSTAYRRHKLHSSELGARPLARGGPGDQTFAPSAWRFALAATTAGRAAPTAIPAGMMLRFSRMGEMAGST
jgi:hypothetical protein